ncbi:MAG: AAA family ATPase, partial [Crenarchaeota archaeon]|nr:AAA family ATPase [Thermoproteota archaeon]
MANSGVLADSDLPSLDASGIAEYIRFDCCPRYFKLRFEGDEEKGCKWPEAFKPLSPLLYEAGKELEVKKVQELQEKAANYYDFSDLDNRVLGWGEAWSQSLDRLKEIIASLSTGKDSLDKPVLAYQVPMCGYVGVWEIRGIADLLMIWPAKNGKIKLRIFEIKSSWMEQTAHRVQVAIYSLLLSDGLGYIASNIDFEGGVINKESDLQVLASDKLPKFKLGPLVQDIQRLLGRNGELYRIHKTPLSEVEYQLCLRCDNCGFNECCIVRAIERESIALLNLTRGEQNTLKQYGITKLEDLAKLKYVPDASDLRPFNFKGVRARDVQKVQQLSADPVIGTKLDRIIQRSQFMLYGIRPSSQFVHKAKVMPWLTGAGYGSLPEDSPQAGEDSALSFRPNGMIRVYFHIEWDYMLAVLSMVSAQVNCTRYHGHPISISKIIEKLPDQHDDCIKEEQNLLENFFLEVTEAINTIAVDVGSPDEAPIHLYFYTRRERDQLMEAVRRHRKLISARAIRDLLGLRQAIDQPMFSIIQDEIMIRKALGYHSTGLMPVLENSGFYDNSNWITKRKDQSIADLRRIFRDGFFNYSLPYSRNPDGKISFILNGDDTRKKDGYYPARARFGNQIPIEYIWAAKGRLDSNKEKGLAKVLIEKRMWTDYPHKTRRISDEDLTLLGSKLCSVLEHIERSLTIRNRRLGKKPIAVPKIAEFTLGPATLERSCREFLDLEYFAKRQELYQHYSLLPYQRVATGRSVIFECIATEETERDFIVRGRLIYGELGLPKSECIANACRVKGSDDSGSGDWMVVTEIKRNEQGQFEETNQRSPSEVEKSARVIVDKVNLHKLELTIKVVSWPSGKNRKYSTWHNLPTSDKEKSLNRSMQLFEAGRTYILDELADDIISERAAKCLDYSENNALYCLLSNFLTGKTNSAKRKPLIRESAQNFLKWVNSRSFPPKPEQSRLIERVFDEDQIIMLQGPPGTGKTETLQIAVLTHIAAHKSNSRCKVLMVAPTHKAIHEFVTKLASCWHSYCKEGANDLKNLRIYRVLSGEVALAKAIDGVQYVNYNEDETIVSELRECLLNQEKLVLGDADNYPMILCVTPPGLYGLMKKIGNGEPAWDEGYFDLLVVDEASMMRLPELILSGA